MTASDTRPITHGPLAEWHRAHGARMSSEAGHVVPAEYSGAATEHQAVRTRAGLFDRSHLAYLEVAGADALLAVQCSACNDAAALGVGEFQPTALTTPAGTVADDLRLHRLAGDHFLVRVSPERAVADRARILDHASGDADVSAIDTSHRYATISLLGPASAEVLQAATDVDLSELAEGQFAHGEVGGVRATVVRAGTAGEDGFECLLPRQPAAVRAWEALLAAGGAFGLAPAGLDAFETLRLEAAVLRYGRDLDETTTMLEAGLEHWVGWHKPEFVGKAALEDERIHGPRRRLAGFEVAGPGVVRRGDRVLAAGALVGRVTSSGAAPWVGRSIGLAYLSANAAVLGTAIDIVSEDRRERARVVPLPFYTRPKG